VPEMDNLDFASELRQLAGSAAGQARPLAPAEVMKRGERRRRHRIAGQCAAVAVVLAAVGGIITSAAASSRPGHVPALGRATPPATSPPFTMSATPGPDPSRHHRAAPLPGTLYPGPGPTQSVQVTVAPSGFVSNPMTPTPTPSSVQPTPSSSPTPTPTPSVSSSASSASGG
jgi:eukaryotic-like serine/threonine-protein kinase